MATARSIIWTKRIHVSESRAVVGKCHSHALAPQRRTLRCVLLRSRPDLRGEWEKDKQNSDLEAYGRMLSLIGLTGLKKTGALKLINGLVIEQNAQPPQLVVRYVVSRVQFLPQTLESFALDQQTQMPRRDGQPGSQTATLNEFENSIQTIITWGKPNPGV